MVSDPGIRRRGAQSPQGRLPDFKAGVERAQRRLGSDGAAVLLDAGRRWDLAPALNDGGAVVFPHVSIEVCGHHTAAAVHACLDSGSDTVLALGVLHALTDELNEARVRVAAGGDPSGEDAWGVQGPGLPGRTDWRQEFSLMNFLFLWREETARRGRDGPELVLRYPYLAGGRPDDLPGIEELERLSRDAVVVATADPFHHGIGYGDSASESLAPEDGGLELARRRIDEGLELLRAGDHWGYNGHCVAAKSDARDVGQVLRHLLGPVRGNVLDLVADDMSGPYDAPAPTWVAGALIGFTPE
jgi:hypothetical protein